MQQVGSSLWILGSRPCVISWVSPVFWCLGFSSVCFLGLFLCVIYGIFSLCDFLGLGLASAWLLGCKINVWFLGSLLCVMSWVSFSWCLGFFLRVISWATLLCDFLGLSLLSVISWVPPSLCDFLGPLPSVISRAPLLCVICACFSFSLFCFLFFVWFLGSPSSVWFLRPPSQCDILDPPALCDLLGPFSMWFIESPFSVWYLGPSPLLLYVSPPSRGEEMLHIGSSSCF